MKMKYDWKKIQDAYNNGMNWEQLTNTFGCCASTLHKAKIRGDFISRSKSQSLKLKYKHTSAPKHTDETKQKISQIRLNFLEKNPDKVPYLTNHSSKKSYPEQIFENALISSNLTGWKYSYRNGIYQYDFAFPEIKLDVEIDGNTHLTEKVKLIDSRRDEWSKSQGWTVLRFTAIRVKTDVVECIEELKKQIASLV